MVVQHLVHRDAEQAMQSTRVKAYANSFMILPDVECYGCELLTNDNGAWLFNKLVAILYAYLYLVIYIKEQRGLRRWRVCAHDIASRVIHFYMNEHDAVNEVLQQGMRYIEFGEQGVEEITIISRGVRYGSGDAAIF